MHQLINLQYVRYLALTAQAWFFYFVATNFLLFIDNRKGLRLKPSIQLVIFAQLLELQLDKDDLSAVWKSFFLPVVFSPCVPSVEVSLSPSRLIGWRPRGPSPAARRMSS